MRVLGSPSSITLASATGSPATRLPPPSSETADRQPAASVVTSTRTQDPASRCSHSVRALIGRSHAGFDRLAGRSSCRTWRTPSWVQILAPGAAVLRGSVVSTTARTSVGSTCGVGFSPPCTPTPARPRAPLPGPATRPRPAARGRAAPPARSGAARPRRTRGRRCRRPGRSRRRTASRRRAPPTPAGSRPCSATRLVRTRSASTGSSRPVTRTGPSTVGPSPPGQCRSPIVAWR